MLSYISYMTERLAALNYGFAISLSERIRYLQARL